MSLCSGCSKTHKRVAVTASHHLIPVTEYSATTAPATRTPRCQHHPSFEIDTYCTRCCEAICANCAVEKHNGHLFSRLSEQGNSLRNEIAGFRVVFNKRTQESSQAATSIGRTISSIEENHSTAESEMSTFFDDIRAAVDARQRELRKHLNEKKEALTATAMKEKKVVDAVALELTEFCALTDCLLAQGTPNEIAGSHKMASCPD